jgi:hypothetical protein
MTCTTSEPVFKTTNAAVAAAAMLLNIFQDGSFELNNVL